MRLYKLTRIGVNYIGDKYKDATLKCVKVYIDQDDFSDCFFDAYNNDEYKKYFENWTSFYRFDFEILETGENIDCLCFGEFEEIK